MSSLFAIAVLFMLKQMQDYGDYPVIKTILGSYRGTEMVTSRGKSTYYAFLGIPYAIPPVEDLRFKDPQPITKPWEDTLNCTMVSSPCLQSSAENDHYGQEDCLTLNVFMKKSFKLAPVMVYIHGGGWRFGWSGGKNIADYLIDFDVVVVSIQYRLGVLGFLSNEDTILPGNLGLKDQSLALQWVHKNIKSFGGDPARVTLFGENAGGASIHYHMASPLSNNLFSGAISMSGIGNKIWGIGKPGTASQVAKKVATLLNCPYEPSLDLVTCLKTKNPIDIVKSEQNFECWGVERPTILQPVIEQQYNGAFMTGNPLNVKSDIPMIIGFTLNDGYLKTTCNNQTVDDFYQNIDFNLEKLLNGEENKTELRSAIKDIESRYFFGKIGFLHFFAPVYKLQQTREASTYFYINDVHSNPVTYSLGGRAFVPNELFFVINSTNSADQLETKKISHHLISMLTDFAKTGSPGKMWIKSDKGRYHLSMKSMEMKETYDYKANPTEEEINFWLNLPIF